MFFKPLLAAIGALGTSLMLAVPVAAQIEEETMEDLGAWGQRFQPAGAREFPQTLWNGSDAEDLLQRLAAISSNSLTPTERDLLRRVLLSPSQKPTGEMADQLLVERARILLELGEADAAAAIAPRLGDDAGFVDADIIAVDLALASGQEATACSALSSNTSEAPYWLKLRAVCAVLTNNYTGAELAVEYAATNGVNDNWLIEAIFAASGDVPNPPRAKFDSGLNIALSAKANLQTQSYTVSRSRPDLTAAAAQHIGLPIDLRARLARNAAETELIGPRAWREILLERMSAEDYSASDPLELTLAVLEDPTSNTGAKAEKLAETLSIYADQPLPVYSAIARLFAQDLDSLPANEVTAPYATLFAKSAIVARDPIMAQLWLDTVDPDSIAAPSPFEVAQLQVIALILDGSATPARQLGVQNQILGATKTNREREAARKLFSAWTGLGMTLGPEARAFLLNADPASPATDPNVTLATRAAAQSGAIGEAALLILSQTAGDPGRLAEPELATLLDLLVDLGAEDIAASLAIEASEIWKN